MTGQVLVSGPGSLADAALLLCNKYPDPLPVALLFRTSLGFSFSTYLMAPFSILIVK